MWKLFFECYTIYITRTQYAHNNHWYSHGNDGGNQELHYGKNEDA